MFLLGSQFRLVFWVAFVPGILAVVLLLIGVRDPVSIRRERFKFPLGRKALVRLGGHYWLVVLVGTVFSLARFSEAFLILRAEGLGLQARLVPLVLVAMNIAYSMTAYPIGHLSDRIGRQGLMSFGLIILIGSDAILACAGPPWMVFFGAALWGTHMGLTQGLLSAHIADSVSPEVRGTAFGVFGLMSGLALFFASLVAGWLWHQFGAPATFWGGALAAGLALLGFLGLSKKDNELTKVMH
jgi:MFS family permease